MDKTAARPTNLVSLAVAAKHYGITAITLRKMVRSGEIPAYRIGEKITRVDLEVLDKLFLGKAS